MSNIRIDIASEFKDKGFKKAQTATQKLNANLVKLGKTVVGVLSVRAITQFGKASVKAFSDDDRAATRLTQTINNLGLAFEDSRIKAFISDLEATSGVLDDSLRPAFQQLLTTTGSVAKSQELLTLALDVAAGSGQDVVSVTNDLSRAYVGQTRGLSKYAIGLTQAELKGKSFNEIQERLSKQFSGQNAAFLETYAGKVSLLNVAYANMQETIGAGLVDAFILLQGENGIAGATDAMEDFGLQVADTIRGVGVLIDRLNNLPGGGGLSLLDVGNIPVVGAYLEIFQTLGRQSRLQPKPFRTPMTVSGSTDAQVKIERDRKKREQEAAKRNKELLALTKKQVKAQEELNKKKKEEGILGDIAKRFDQERIQIAAALQGQVGEVERLRLELMQALLDEDVKRAIILEGQLIKAEAAAAELALLLDSLDEMVGNPFADWPGTISRIQELLKTLKINVPIETLFAEKGLKLDQKTMTVTTLERMDVDANNVYINGNLFGGGGGDGLGRGGGGGSSVLDDLAAKLYREGNEIIIPAVEAHADALLTLAESELSLADLLLTESGGAPVEVTVNVQGSVITEQDLSAVILDNLYKYQKAGQGLLLSSLAI